MSAHFQTKVEGGTGKSHSSPTTGRMDIVVDVYKLLVLAGRMHDCLVQDANL